MANYIFIGYGKTDENGIAKLDHDAQGNPITHSYTGTGAGEIDVVASLDDDTEISDSSILSETFSVWDTKWFDLATSNDKESSWQNPQNLDISYSENGRTVTKSVTGTNWNYWYYNDSTLSTVLVGNRYSIPTPNKIEFEVTSVTGSIVIDVFDNLNNHLDNYTITSTGLYTIELDGTDVKIYKDNGTTPVATKTMNGTNIRFGFVLNAQNESITYKNFKVYSL